mgnify:CR=1 FL=1
MAKANEIKYLTAIKTEKPKKKSAPKKAAAVAETE